MAALEAERVASGVRGGHCAVPAAAWRSGDGIEAPLREGAIQTLQTAEEENPEDPGHQGEAAGQGRRQELAQQGPARAARGRAGRLRGVLPHRRAQRSLPRGRPERRRHRQRPGARRSPPTLRPRRGEEARRACPCAGPGPRDHPRKARPQITGPCSERRPAGRGRARRRHLPSPGLFINRNGEQWCAPLRQRLLRGEPALRLPAY